MTILALAVSSYHLGTRSLAYDELVSEAHARLGMHGLWVIVSHQDTNMSLYYVLLHFWVRIFGHGAVALRSLSVIFGGLAVPVTVLLGKRLFGRETGLVAGLLLALSPFFVFWEQFARSYSLVVLLVALSSYFLVAALERPSRAMRIGYVLAIVVAILAHYFAAYVLLVQVLTLLAVKRRAALTREWLSVWAVASVVCIGLAVETFTGTGTHGISWIHPPPVRWLFGLPVQLAGGSNTIGRLTAAALVTLGCYGFVRVLADRPRWRVGFVAAWCVVPVLLDFAVSRLVQPMFLAYYLIVVLPAFLLLAAAGLVRLPRRAAGIIVLLALVVLSAVGTFSGVETPSSRHGHPSAAASASRGVT